MIMKVKFTQFFDISSDSTKFTKFTVTAGGDYVKMRCAPQFVCYKYFKLGPVSIKLVPASTLPVDPTGLSYETGETTVDPRDMFNPGLVRITNGEPVGDFNASDMNQYYATLLDPRWYKFQLQQGFSRYAKPLVYNIGEIAQEPFPFAGVHVNNSSGTVPDYYYQQGDASFASGGGSVDTARYIDTHSPLQTGRVKLGWMPTDAVMKMANASVNGVNTFSPNACAYVPEIDLITFILPKAFKTKFFYRVFIESTVYFKEPVAVNPIIVKDTDKTLYSYLPLDRGVGMQIKDIRSYTGGQKIPLGDSLGYHSKVDSVTGGADE